MQWTRKKFRSKSLPNCLIFKSSIPFLPPHGTQEVQKQCQVTGFLRRRLGTFVLGTPFLFPQEERNIRPSVLEMTALKIVRFQFTCRAQDCLNDLRNKSSR